MKAAQIATNEINAQGGLLGRQVTIISGDDQSDPAVGVSMIERLITLDQVNVIVGMYHSSVTLAQMEILAKYKVPTINVFSENPAIPDKVRSDPTKYKYFWKIELNSTAGVLTIVAAMKYFIDNGLVRHKTGKLALVMEDSDFGRSYAPEFEKDLPALGVPLALASIQYVPIGSTDLYSVITKANQDDPDLFYVNINSEAIDVAFVKQFHELGINKMLIGGLGLGYADLPELVGEAGIGLLDCAGTAGNITTVGKHFNKAYAEIYGNMPDVDAFSEYDGMYIMFQAIQRAGSLDPDAINGELAKTHYQGVQTGTYVFYPDSHEQVFGYNGRTRVCQQLQQGETRKVIWPDEFKESPLLIAWTLDSQQATDVVFLVASPPTLTATINCRSLASRTKTTS